MISGKGSAASVNGAAGGLSPSAGDLRSEPLRKFLGSKEHLDWLNNTHRENFVLLNSVQEFIEIQAWLLLTFFLFLPNQLISVYYIITNIRVQMFKKCDSSIRKKWLLLTAFQQGFRQKLTWSLSSHKKTLFLRGFILKPTERA